MRLAASLQPLDELDWEDLPAPEGEESLAESSEAAAPEAPEGEEMVPYESRSSTQTPLDEADPLEQELNLQPPAPRATRTPRPGKRAPVFPQTWFSVGIKAGPRAVGAGLGATYFVIPALGIGLEVDNIVNWDDHGAINQLQLTPVAWGLLLPRFNTTPFVCVGFGGEFFSRRLGVYGRWLAGGGVLFRIQRRWMVELGIDVVEE